MQGYADDRALSQGQVAEGEEVGEEQQEAGEVSKETTTFTTSTTSSRSQEGKYRCSLASRINRGKREKKGEKDR